MYVPNYVPEPEVAPENVTLVRYRDRLSFIRHALYRFLGSVAIIVGVGVVSPIGFTLTQSIYLLICGVVFSSLTRTVLRNTPSESKVAVLTLLPLLMVYGIAGRNLSDAGWPVWSVAVGVGCFGIYGALCGRDFSFVGGFTLSLIVSSVIIALVVGYGLESHTKSIRALLINLVGLFYIVYDLAALLSRRKVGESWAAVVDLLRDPLNIFGYVPRVVMHWNRHQILNDLSFELPFRNDRNPAN
ncbi:MAG TPA: hypothetical protein VK171_03995 [Fimbriimonas sp.]|nr:hypothetical protein [Fimbriimonas sp.]